jgi:Lipid A 3-O-deacylase (PagL)
MSVRKLILLAVMLGCLAQAAKSIAQDPTSQPSQETLRVPKPDFNKEIYYKNRLDFSFESGWLPVNIPFVFDFLLGDGYNMTPLKYTLVPNIASLRWQLDGVRGPWILRGNWDLSFSGALVVIPRGPETHYGAYIMGIRRNFVRPHCRIAPYVDGRLGLGDINAKEPLGVQFAQGQDFTFTMNLGAGARYNFSRRGSISAGMNWMHISNLYLSEPKFLNYGINVYGPMAGIYIRLGKDHADSQ